jgi:hypothetical protein
VHFCLLPICDVGNVFIIGARILVFKLHFIVLEIGIFVMKISIANESRKLSLYNIIELSQLISTHSIMEPTRAQEVVAAARA